MENKIKTEVWIFHHDATPPNIRGFSRPYDFGRYLNKKAYNTTVFASSFLKYGDYNLIDNKDKYIVDNSSEIPFVFVNTPSPNKGLMLRFLNMAVFYKNIFTVVKKYLKNDKALKPDVIIASSPHPLVMLAGIKIAKRLKVPCICEVRDFWPEVFFFGGLIKEDSLIGKILVWGEHYIYKKADAIIFLKEGDYTYLTDKKWDKESGGKIDLAKTYYINNGVDNKQFAKDVLDNQIKDKDLSSEKFKVVYTGSISPTNDIGSILDTAVLLKDYKDIVFLVYGSGSEKAALQARIEKEKITNVIMKGDIDKKYIPYVLSMSSVNLLNYSQDRYNWSRGNSSNKLFEYMASAKPIISTVKMGFCPLEKYECGISLENNSPTNLAAAILKLKNMPKKDYENMGLNAKNAAKEFDFEILTDKLISVIENVTKEKNIWLMLLD